MARDPLQVSTLLYDGLCTFEFGIVVELFGLPRPELGRWYQFRAASLHRGPVTALGGVKMESPHGLQAFDRAGTIVIPGWRTVDDPVPSVLIRKLRRAYDEGARILSVCSGAFVLGAAGLLDGRRVTTHWRYADALAKQVPAATVDREVLYVDEGNILTSAGSAAGIDMGLHLIRRDFGAETANLVARRMVVPPHRDGGQQQFIEAPTEPDADAKVFSTLLDELRQNPAAPLSLTDMARRVHMSTRTFARRFKATTGTTPHRWLQTERVRQAQRLLETTALPLQSVAEQCGFSDAQLLRLHFRRIVGTAPTAYRRAFNERNCRGHRACSNVHRQIG